MPSPDTELSEFAKSFYITIDSDSSSEDNEENQMPNRNRSTPRRKQQKAKKCTPKVTTPLRGRRRYSARRSLKTPVQSASADDSVQILSPLDVEGISTNHPVAGPSNLLGKTTHTTIVEKTTPSTPVVQSQRRVRGSLRKRKSIEGERRLSSGNITIDLIDDEDEAAPRDEVIVLDDDETVRVPKKEVVVKKADEDEIEIVEMRFMSPVTQGTSSGINLGRSSIKGKKYGTRRRSSLSYLDVKHAVDKAKKRVSGNLSIARASHGIQKKKNKKPKFQGSNFQQPSNHQRYQNPMYRKRFIRPRRHTSPVFLLNRELGPINSNYNSRSNCPFPSFGSSEFIPFSSSGNNGGISQSSRTTWSREGFQSMGPPPPEFNVMFSAESNVRAPGSFRPIIIDGSNVAMAHGKSRGVFSCRGIKLCVDFFKSRGHTEVVAFVPQHRRKHSESENTEILDELEKEGVVKFTPSREVNGRRITAYDDRYIVQYAHLKSGIIVSNDQYRDLLKEENGWKDTIDNRLLNFTWMDDTTLFFPLDPLGRSGPPLHVFLRF